MKTVILAGGYGTRIAEESVVRPKPMVEIGGMPILWHIMKIYSQHGLNDFVVCLGYKGYMIKEYFANYYLHMSDLTVDLSDNTMQVHQNFAEPWKVTLVDTGEDTLTGGRLKRVRDYLGDEEFCFTYGDGGWVNGGFFVLSPKTIDYIEADHTHWEREPLSRLALEGQLVAYKHTGFWRPMDTLRDKTYLENLWVTNQAPWRTW